MGQTQRVYVYNLTRETFLATEASVAATYVRRLVGLLGQTPSWARSGRGLWIVPSRGVHTIGMMFPIDLIFLDRNKNVLHTEEHVRPFHVSKVVFKSESVLELPTHTIFRTGTTVGDRLEIAHFPHIPENGNGNGIRSQSSQKSNKRMGVPKC